MDRKNQVLEKSREIIDEGRKPTASGISQELSWAEEDVHRLLNALEKDGEVKTYSREILGGKKRLVSLYRSKK